MVLTLLVFGAYPRISNLDPPVPLVIERATVIRKVIVKVAKLRAKRVVNDTLYHRNGPDTTPVHDLPLNSEVLV